jgi:hypothetical protein
MVAVSTLPTFTPINVPYITQQEIIDALRVTIPNQWNIPIYDEFPSEVEKVRFGLYVGKVYTINRTVNSLGVTYCGSIYNADDTFQVNYVSFQQDPYEVDVCNIVNNLTTLQIDNVPLFDGYFSNLFDTNLTYGPTRAAIYTWNFRLTRMDFNTPN